MKEVESVMGESWVGSEFDFRVEHELNLGVHLDILDPRYIWVMEMIIIRDLLPL